MIHLPIFLDLAERRCVVIGGGSVAERKVRSLLKAGAHVTVVSPDLNSALAAMRSAGTVLHRARNYRPGDLAGAFLVFEASGNADTAQAACAEARAANVLINVADDPEFCSFITPAVVRRGGFQIAISTGGASPGFAQVIREELEERFGPEYETLIELLRAARRWLMRREADAAARSQILNRLARSPLRECVERGDLDAANEILGTVLGASLTEIGFERAHFARTPPGNPR